MFRAFEHLSLGFVSARDELSRVDFDIRISDLDSTALPT